jgi:hypothetical protein
MRKSDLHSEEVSLSFVRILDYPKADVLKTDCLIVSYQLLKANIVTIQV